MPAYTPQPQVVPDYTAPTGFTYSTWPRNIYSNVQAAPVTTSLWLTAIVLPAGFRVGKIAFNSGTVAAATPTHWWFGLYDSARVQLATTANQTTAAWAASTLKSLTIATTAAGAATSYTTTYTGLYYLGFCMSATTMVNLPATAISAGMNAIAPILGGPSSSGLSTPPAFPFTAAAMTGNSNPPYAAVGL